MRGKTQFSIHFSTAHSQGDNLKGLIAQETKDRVVQVTATHKLEEPKKIGYKTFVSREFSVISRAKTFANFEFRLCLGRNFREKLQKNAKIAKLSVRETFCP